MPPPHLSIAVSRSYRFSFDERIESHLMQSNGNANGQRVYAELWAKGLWEVLPASFGTLEE